MSKQIIAGGVAIGGGAPVTIQSMCNTHTEDAKATIAQIHALEEAGCEIVRVTVPNMEAAHALSEIKENISIPLVADIHFDYRLAVEAAARGADKIRINPGNIGGDDRVKAVVDACREHKVPIRIGVNGGSLEKELLAKYGRVTPEALVESALRHVRLLEKFDFTEICISVKSSDVPLNMAAYRLLHEKGRLSAPPRRDRGGHAHDGAFEVRHRHRRPSVRGHRRHDARLAHGGPRGRGLRRQAHFCRPAASAAAV